MRAWIICKGIIEEQAFYRTIKMNEEDLIICTDGGFNHAMLLGLKPDVLIGDTDFFEKSPFTSNDVIKCRNNKERSDVHVAVDYALEHNFNEIIMLGAVSGEISTSLANIMLLIYINQVGGEGLILTKQKRICLVSHSTFIKRGMSDKVSLIPLTLKVTGVTTVGLECNFQNFDLFMGDTLASETSFSAPEATVSILSGMLLVICSN